MQNIKPDKCVKIIMTTALNEEKDVRQAYDMGCTAYTAKPVDMWEFDLLLERIGLVHRNT